MDEYISKKAILQHLNNCKEDPLFDPDMARICFAIGIFIENMKTADVQPVDRWISVKDRLPEAVEEDVNGKIAYSDFVLVYLVYDDGFTYITNDKCRVDNKSWLHEIPGEGCKVTHWMPLPEPPKDGDAE
jgi:hypothetical protein